MNVLYMHMLLRDDSFGYRRELIRFAKVLAFDLLAAGARDSQVVFLRKQYVELSQ
jgi:hypothetical protein